MPLPETTVVEVEGKRLKLSNLGKVLYPAAGFTKGQVIDYYVKVAPAILTHIQHRGISLRRFPNGVDGQSFWEKRCPSHRPAWVETAPGPGDRGGSIDYCCLNDLPSLVWVANLAALEIHAPMARRDDIDAPKMVVFDLDPGAPAAIRECAEVAVWIHDLLSHLGLESVAKTSGSKGMQVYVPLNVGGHTHDQASAFALAIAQLVEKQHPKAVLTVMTKAMRGGKVFIDWSQNSRHKTTICAYSLRALPMPTVSTPVTWQEVEAAADGASLAFEAADVIERVTELGDVFAPAASVEQHLPSARP